MSQVIIPWQDASSFKQTITLAGVKYVFVFKWNTSHEHWTMDILTPTGDVLIAGVKLVLGVELLDRYRRSYLPGGYMMAVPDADTVLLRINRNGMGNGVNLVFIEK